MIKNGHGRVQRVSEGSGGTKTRGCMNTTNTHRNREGQTLAMIVGGADDNSGDVHTCEVM